MRTGRTDHLDLTIAAGRDLVPHGSGQNDATVRSGPGILDRVAVDQESVATERVGAGLRREGQYKWTMRRRVVRWANVINALGDWADVMNVFEIRVVLAFAGSGGYRTGMVRRIPVGIPAWQAGRLRYSIPSTALISTLAIPTGIAIFHPMFIS